MDGRSTREANTYYRKDLTNQRFGKLTVIKAVGKNKHRNILWECKCECGNTKIYPGGKLVSGKATNCGCMTTQIKRKAASKHGITAGGKPRTFIIWNGIKARCLNPKSIEYQRYGGRGITISKEWLDFQNFHIWAMKNGYDDSLEIDRIDNDGNYCPENCRWASRSENARNRSDNHYIEILGIKKVVSDWIEILGISKSKAYKILKSGDKALVEYAINTKGQQYFINKFLTKGRTSYGS